MNFSVPASMILSKPSNKFEYNNPHLNSSNPQSIFFTLHHQLNCSFSNVSRVPVSPSKAPILPPVSPLMASAPTPLVPAPPSLVPVLHPLAPAPLSPTRPPREEPRPQSNSTLRPIQLQPFPPFLVRQYIASSVLFHPITPAPFSNQLLMPSLINPLASYSNNVTFLKRTRKKDGRKYAPRNLHTSPAVAIYLNRNTSPFLCLYLR